MKKNKGRKERRFDQYHKGKTRCDAGRRKGLRKGYKEAAKIEET